jgi:hypothetical protein
MTVKPQAVEIAVAARRDKVIFAVVEDVGIEVVDDQRVRYMDSLVRPFDKLPAPVTRMPSIADFIE